ncbi:hypothetical protein FRUB_04461 [Fimbriiglobus ruber]|uniref:Uncharacterized protein n=1 Tax=Fimbriiglobus ruber TaxID=1908690 RepID=A0A225DMY2_9BACT|nr:hypothetical protein FRUB_04461 [Fimbriiglobus ruber]
MLTPHEARLGLESVAALERLLDERHVEQIKEGGCAVD